MSEPDSTPELMARLRKGDPQAAEQLFARYAEQLISLAEHHLSRRLAVRTGGEDVVQSVFRTFFRRTARGEFQLDSPTQIGRLLVKITLLKARAEGRRHTAEKRNVRAEVASPNEHWWHDLVAQEPGPAEAAVLVDEVEALLRGLPAVFGQVLEMRLQGHPVPDIAQHLRVSARSIYRMLEILQKRLERQESGIRGQESGVRNQTRGKLTPGS